MGLEEKVGFLTRLRNGVKKSLGTRIIALSLLGSVGLGYTNCGGDEQIHLQCEDKYDCDGDYFCYDGYCVAEELSEEDEICDGKDNDFDGDIDKDRYGNPLERSCYTGPYGTEGVGICHDGWQECVNGSWSSCYDEVTPEKEICDGEDNDCDGKDDEDFLDKYEENDSKDEPYNFGDYTPFMSYKEIYANILPVLDADWFKAKVIDDSWRGYMKVKIELSQLPQDYDLCAYWVCAEGYDSISGCNNTLETAYRPGYYHLPYIDGDTRPGCCSRNSGTTVDDLWFYVDCSWTNQDIEDTGEIYIRVTGDSYTTNCENYKLRFKFSEE
jgi:hypothetical protein